MEERSEQVRETTHQLCGPQGLTSVHITSLSEPSCQTQHYQTVLKVEPTLLSCLFLLKVCSPTSLTSLTGMLAPLSRLSQDSP